MAKLMGRQIEIMGRESNDLKGGMITEAGDG